MEDPVTIRTDVVPKAMDGGDMVLLTKYEAPGGQFTADEWKEYDIWAAGRMMDLLLGVFPGYPWHTIHDTKQGYAKVSIPILMGVNWGIILHLPVTLGPVIAAGGEVLERYQQSRDRMHLDSFLDARAQHSKLVSRQRPIPE